MAAGTASHGADFRIGDFTYHADGGEGEVTIRSATRHTYSVELNVAADGCNGQAVGTGIATADGVDFVSSAKEGDPTCHASITIKGGKVRVQEVENCSDYHGGACAFSSYP